MTAYYIICLFLSHTIDVFVHCLDTVPAQTTILPHKIIQCNGPLCWKDTSGSGTMAGTEHVAPDAAIFNGKNNSLARNGEIITFSDRPTDLTELRAGLLGTTVCRSGDRFTRYIMDLQDHRAIGFMNVERPVPDPDTRFDSLAQDPLLAAILAGLRPAVDPASLIPLPTKGCPTTIASKGGCFLVIPSADVFYFGPDPTNTACLASMPTPPPSPAPPQVSMDPSSVYVVYQPPQIFDECREWLGGIYGPPVTISYQPASLSTLEYRPNAPPATKTLDFADLPCPPSGVAEAYSSGAPYFPVLVSPFGVEVTTIRLETNDTSFIGILKGHLKIGPLQCQVVAVRDPPVRAIRVPKITGPKDGDGPIP